MEMVKNKNKIISLFLSIAILFAMIISIPTQRIDAQIKYTKNTQDYINNILNGMPEYKPSGMDLYVDIKGEVYKIDATVLISAIVQAEMVGSYNGNPYEPSDNIKEALKAQAVAATSFIKYTNDRGSAISWYQFADKKPSAGTVRVVEEVVGQYLTYNGQTAQTFFMASSGLHTQSSKYMWGQVDIPYLRGVACKYDEAVSTKTMSLEEVRSILNSRGFDTSSDPSSWFNVTQTVDGGYIYKINICGVEKSGEYVYSILNLKTPKATITYNAGQKSFEITTKGYGHGIGMSQISAMGYSKYENMSYDKILSIFFQNTKLEGVSTTVEANGDVNNDGVVNISDIVLIQNYILGRSDLTSEQLQKADVTKDGKINISDIIKIQNHILGRSTIN